MHTSKWLSEILKVVSDGSTVLEVCIKMSGQKRIENHGLKVVHGSHARCDREWLPQAGILWRLMVEDGKEKEQQF